MFSLVLNRLIKLGCLEPRYHPTMAPFSYSKIQQLKKINAKMPFLLFTDFPVNPEFLFSLLETRVLKTKGYGFAEA